MNKKITNLYLLSLTLLLCLSALNGRAQQKVAIDDRVNQHIFSFGEITYLEDPKGTLTFNQVTSPQASSQFKPSPSSTPENYNLASVYWYKITIEYPLRTKKKLDTRVF